MSAPIQPTGIDTRRVAQMVVYCLCAGLATGFAAWGAGATTKAAVAAGAAAIATTARGYWFTSPKNGLLVDAVTQQDGGGS